jgi:hypothetical protein
MRKIFAYFISALFTILSASYSLKGQDTTDFPLKIRIGIELSGPVTYYTDKDILNTEVYISADLDEKHSLIIAGGHLDYKYSQYNYEYLNKGTFFKTGMDFNLLKPAKAKGKYWAGIGIRYGISHYTYEVPTFSLENYWGITTSSIAAKTSWGHYLEASPGIRTEIFKNLSLGWSVNVRILLYSGAGKDIRPINFPGYGVSSNKTSTSMSYYLIWNIPFKRIRVITKKETPPETDDTEANNPNQTNR